MSDLPHDCAASTSCGCGCHEAKTNPPRNRRREGMLETKAFVASENETEDGLDDLLDDQYEELLDAMREEWIRQGLSFTEEELRDALDAGDISEDMEEAIAAGYETMVADSLVPSWEESLVAGAAVLGLTLSAAAIAAWISTRSEEQVERFTGTQVDSMNAVASASDKSEAGVNMLRRAAGLTEKQSRGLMSQRDTLEEAGATEDTIEDTLDETADRTMNNRAGTLAEGLPVEAYAAGMDEAVAESDLEVERLWWTREDARVCPICEPLHATVTELTPPGDSHPRCRCFLMFRIIEE